MLVVTVEIWPGGYELGKKKIAEMKVANASYLADLSDYTAIVEDFGNERLEIEPSRHFVKVNNHERKQSVWNLIRKVLQQI